ncbi:MAG: macro domain-containing protein [Hallerella sp.]|nr:macro domain-containing protein [Hallerella sp.]
MPLNIIRNDISKVHADAIVNSANPHPICGGGAESHIFQAAGFEALLKAREAIGELSVAEVAVSPAFALPAKYVIHTVGPKWNGGTSGEVQDLENCYSRSLKKAKELGCKSIAFPLISSGVYKFPKDSALQIALRAIENFLQTNEMNVMLVVFDRESLEVSEELHRDISSYINDFYAEEKTDAMLLCVQDRLTDKCRVEKFHDNLEDVLAEHNDTFCEKLFHFIQEKKLDDVDVYKKANLDRKHFSKIRSNVNYRPTMKTALALAIALQLNISETKDLLSRAGLALSPSNKGDLIVSFFITHGKFDIWEINSMLFKFGQPTLGA